MKTFRIHYLFNTEKHSLDVSCAQEPFTSQDAVKVLKAKYAPLCVIDTSLQIIVKKTKLLKENSHG
jgi:hypothetical protein